MFIVNTFFKAHDYLWIAIPLIIFFVALFTILLAQVTALD